MFGVRRARSPPADRRPARPPAPGRRMQRNPGVGQRLGQEHTRPRRCGPAACSQRCARPGMRADDRACRLRSAVAWSLHVVVAEHHGEPERGLRPPLRGVMIRSTTPAGWPARPVRAAPAGDAATSLRQAGPRCPGRLGGDARQDGVGVRCGARAAEHYRIARLQAQCAGADRDVGPGLVDDRDHSSGTRTLRISSPLASREPSITSPTGSAGGDPAHAGGHPRSASGRARAGPAARRTVHSRVRARDRARWPRGSRPSGDARRRSLPAPRQDQRVAGGARGPWAARHCRRACGGGHAPKD